MAVVDERFYKSWRPWRRVAMGVKAKVRVSSMVHVCRRARLAGELLGMAFDLLGSTFRWGTWERRQHKTTRWLHILFCYVTFGSILKDISVIYNLVPIFIKSGIMPIESDWNLIVWTVTEQVVFFGHASWLQLSPGCNLIKLGNLAIVKIK